MSQTEFSSVRMEVVRYHRVNAVEISALAGRRSIWLQRVSHHLRGSVEDTRGSSVSLWSVRSGTRWDYGDWSSRWKLAEQLSRHMFRRSVSSCSLLSLDASVRWAVGPAQRRDAVWTLLKSDDGGPAPASPPIPWLPFSSCPRKTSTREPFSQSLLKLNRQNNNK